jgi:hypothetical protein
MIGRVLGKMFRFASEKTYGGLKDNDRIFTNLYRDGDPYIKGALKRVSTNVNAGRLAPH